MWCWCRLYKTDLFLRILNISSSTSYHSITSNRILPGFPTQAPVWGRVINRYGTISNISSNENIRGLILGHIFIFSLPPDVNTGSTQGLSKIHPIGKQELVNVFSSVHACSSLRRRRRYGFDWWSIAVAGVMSALYVEATLLPFVRHPEFDESANDGGILVLQHTSASSARD